MKTLVLLLTLLATPAFAGQWLGDDGNEWTGGNQRHQRFNEDTTFQQPMNRGGGLGSQCAQTMCPPPVGGVQNCFCTMWR